MIEDGPVVPKQDPKTLELITKNCAGECAEHHVNRLTLTYTMRRPKRWFIGYILKTTAKPSVYYQGIR